MMETDFEISRRQEPVLIKLCESLELAQAQSRAVFDNALEDGFPIPPDVHATLIASLCRIQSALDSSLTL